jgi:triosephosphate isomerase
VRVPFVAGNWKMHKDLASARALVHELREALLDVPLVGPDAAAPPGPGAVEAAVFPSHPLLLAVSEALAGHAIAVGAQNCHSEPEGAFTGEVSCEQIRSVGARYVVIGHSERRRLFREEDGWLNLKLRAAFATGLRPILCVGETDAERSAGRTEAVVSQQLSLSLDGFIAREIMGLLTIAYEPVWAIGTGKNATPEQAQEVHAFIRGFLADRFSPALAAATRIQYGGSRKTPRRSLPARTWTARSSAGRASRRHRSRRSSARRKRR